MYVRNIKDKLRGASLVEFALGASVFFLIIFGMISLSLALSSKILLIRAADYVSLDAMTNTDIRLDTHQSTCTLDCVQKYNTALSLVSQRGMNFIRSSWLLRYLYKFYKTSPSTNSQISSAATEIAIVRPGERWTSTIDNKVIDYAQIYSGTDFPCDITNKSYTQVLNDCPIHVEVRAKIKIWPLGEFSISGTSTRYAERFNARSVVPVSGNEAANFSLPTFSPTSTPIIQPPTPTPTGHVTDTPIHTPTYNPLSCPGSYPDADAAAVACFIPGRIVTNCYNSCVTNQGNTRFICVENCGAGR